MKPCVCGRRWLTGILVSIYICLTFISASEFEPQENVALTQFQLLARSDLVVHARVFDGEGRFAIVDVLQTILGTAPSERLRIDFRDLNFERRGLELVVFRKDEEYILLLEPPKWRKPKEKHRDLFALYHGRRGRIAVPPEGGGVRLEAVEKLATLVGRTPDDQVAGLRSMLTSTNPLLREAALAEIARLGAAGPADLSALASLLQDANSGIRSSALRIIRGVMQLPAQEMEETEKRTVLELCRERARNDPSEQVRTVAVRVIGAWPKKEDVVGDLRAIARSDSSQSVRYEAMRILFAWGMTGSSRDP